MTELHQCMPSCFCKVSSTVFPSMFHMQSSVLTASDSSPYMPQIWASLLFQLCSTLPSLALFSSSFPVSLWEPLSRLATHIDDWQLALEPHFEAVLANHHIQHLGFSSSWDWDRYIDLCVRTFMWRLACKGTSMSVYASIVPPAMSGPSCSAHSRSLVLHWVLHITKGVAGARV